MNPELIPESLFGNYNGPYGVKRRRMLAKVKRRWVRALRSGRYQRQANTGTGPAYLLLRAGENAWSADGVLVDLYRRSSSKHPPWQRCPRTNHYAYGTLPCIPYKGVSAFLLPQEVMRWSGIMYRGGQPRIFLPPRVRRRLYSMCRFNERALQPEGWYVGPIMNFMIYNMPFDVQADLIEEFM